MEEKPLGSAQNVLEAIPDQDEFLADEVRRLLELRFDDARAPVPPCSERTLTGPDFSPRLAPL